MRLNWFEAHHLYWGVLAMWLGAVLSPYTTWSFWAYIAGGIVALDDIYQHHRQVEEPEYHSPVHRTYGWFYHKFEWIRNLNESVSDLIHNLRKK